MTKIARGLIKLKKRNIHKSTAALLTVPRYRDDQDDEDTAERGRILVSTAEGWRTVMAKWIGDARAAEAEMVEEPEEEEETPPRLGRAPSGSKWKKKTLRELFGGATKKHVSRLSQNEIDVEAALMAALAETLNVPYLSKQWSDSSETEI
ncbi:hypothetical protein FB451DRAFT_1476747 [Mycena latifolia]|nr:hypothetical protein FB451DRAFT_1476747 [Mycena latifolia]